MKGNFYENERVALFIDGANLYSAARSPSERTARPAVAAPLNGREGDDLDDAPSEALMRSA